MNQSLFTISQLNKEVQMKLYASGEDYLETILVLQKKLGMVN